MSIASLKRLRVRLLALTERLSFLAPALIRVTVGLVFLRTGWGKLHDLDGTTEYFASLHIPMAGLNARIASATEFFGGILILVGLGARLVALPLAFTMVVAIVSAQLGEVKGLIDFVALDEWSYLVMFLVIALRGPGTLSLDALLARRLAR
jgi:putative oxidoreductase